MAQFTYRHVRADFHADGNRVPREDGRLTDKYLEIRDTLADATIIPDRWGEDRPQFQVRAEVELMGYLDRLGAEGWQVTAYTQVTVGMAPFGSYVLSRTRPEPPGWQSN